MLAHSSAGRKASGFEIVPYPRVPLEGIYSRRNFLRILTSRHSRDLLVIFTGALSGALFVTTLVLGVSDATKTQLYAAMISSFLATLGAIYQLSKRRFSTVDVFSSEILARMRILAADNSIAEILEFSDEQHIAAYSQRSAKSTEGGYAVLLPSQESYFETFHRRSDDLGGLGSVVVDHVTDFYCFHMAARDQLRELTSTIENFPERIDDIKHQVIDVIFMIDLWAFSGLRALDELIESKNHKWHSWQVAMSVGTRANAFLLSAMSDDDHRLAEVMHRNDEYASRIRTLKRVIRPRLLGQNLISRGEEYF